MRANKSRIGREPYGSHTDTYRIICMYHTMSYIVETVQTGDGYGAASMYNIILEEHDRACRL